MLTLNARTSLDLLVVCAKRDLMAMASRVQVSKHFFSDKDLYNEDPRMLFIKRSFSEK